MQCILMADGPIADISAFQRYGNRSEARHLQSSAVIALQHHLASTMTTGTLGMMLCTCVAKVLFSLLVH